jgi:hypothetical protein
MKKTASLGAGLIATKGKAAPSAEIQRSSTEQTSAQTKAAEKRIAITVKLLEGPYQRMKIYGASNRKTNQDMLEEALEEYLSKRGA